MVIKGFSGLVKRCGELWNDAERMDESYLAQKDEIEVMLEIADTLLLSEPNAAGLAETRREILAAKRDLDSDHDQVLLHKSNVDGQAADLKRHVGNFNEDITEIMQTIRLSSQIIRILAQRSL
jgi:hypothetical protein